ncbi:DNA oxidative demethylase ALKBH2 [Colletotrichum trifolii]|uniref:DNA oxidative demethylase ALKBH2 n=1 Tax=Colletotrichum trifolii TaxID=5466 RepID=A0A4R8QJK3_COLTR|nr:DNA oxidative demethylase ALKBH2 [Colletotrichum trifolii]
MGLLVIDFQNDFLSIDGALPVNHPENLVSRTLQLVEAFRAVGDVVWVCSEFDEPRSSIAEQILATDALPITTALATRLRRRPLSVIADPDGKGAISDADPEAFLSSPGSPIVRSSTLGAQLPTAAKQCLGSRDINHIKSHYSAFHSGHLLQLLRVKFVTELFLCGSLANVGVYATAIDAAKYGYSITLVEDCCGYRSDLRQANAIRSLIDLTGCDVVESSVVVQKSKSANASASSPKVSPSSVVPRRVDQTIMMGSLAAVEMYDTDSLEAHMAGLNIDRATHQTAGAATSDKLEIVQRTQPPPSVSDFKGSGRSHTRQRESFAPSHNTAENHTITATSIDMKAEKRVAKMPADLTNASSDSELEADPKVLRTEMHVNMEIQRNRGGNESHTCESMCEGDTTIIHNILPQALANTVFEEVRDEVCWRKMSHQGGEVPRLVAVQGEVGSDGSMPVYRHPSDESPPLLPFSATVLKIKAEVEKHLGHQLNHVLIQFYRDGTDYISEHSDKTLDIVRKSYIANVSLGAERTMVFRTKRRNEDSPNAGVALGQTPNQRQIYRAKLPHNSLCRMGLKTNMCWLHAIKQDKRMDREKTPAELAFSGGRISLTFRQIGTFLDRDGELIWGQGATGKTQAEAQSVVNGQSPEAVSMLQAFGTENHSTEFEWERHYGKGFDVLHMSSSPRFFASVDTVVNMRVAMMLAEYGISYAKGSMPASLNWKDGDSGGQSVSAAPENLAIRFVDNDSAKSTAQGELAIMLYLDTTYGSGKEGAPGKSRDDMARLFSRFQQGLALLVKWRRQLDGANSGKGCADALEKELAIWNKYAGQSDFMNGSTVSLADFAVWPVLHAMVENAGIDTFTTKSSLQEYYMRIRARKSTDVALGTK